MYAGCQAKAAVWPGVLRTAGCSGGGLESNGTQTTHKLLVVQEGGREISPDTIDSGIHYHSAGSQCHLVAEMPALRGLSPWRVSEPELLVPTVAVESLLSLAVAP